MKDIMGMMGKVKEMQAKMEDMQAELENLEAEGMSAGGMVTVTLSGKGLMKGLTVDPSLLVSRGGRNARRSDHCCPQYRQGEGRRNYARKDSGTHRRASHSSGNETSDLNPAVHCETMPGDIRVGTITCTLSRILAATGVLGRSVY